MTAIDGYAARMTDEKPEDPKADAPPKPEKATDELAEAAKHVKHAAQIFFDKASKDPSFKAAAAEAERVIEKVGSSAEPLAKQIASELGKLGRAIAQNLEGAKKPDPEMVPPPATDAKPADAKSEDDTKK